MDLFSRRNMLLAGVAALTPTYLFGALPASAQASPAPAASKTYGIGIVNIQNAIVTCNEGKKAFEDLRQRFAPQQTSLKQENDDVQALQKQLQAQGANLSKPERDKRQKDLETKRATLQEHFAVAQKDFQQAEQELVNRLGSKIMGVLEKYSKDNGYVLILDVSNPQTPVLWAGAEANITKQLVDAYNALPAAAAPAPHKPKPSSR